MVELIIIAMAFVPFAVALSDFGNDDADDSAMDHMAGSGAGDETGAGMMDDGGGTGSGSGSGSGAETGGGLPPAPEPEPEPAVPTAGPDVLVGTDAADSIDGLAGGDLISGGGGLDFLFGNDDNDTINGEGGADTLIGGEGADSMLGGDGADSLDGSAGNDLLDGGTGADTLIGGTGVDRLVGGSGPDVLFGALSTAADSEMDLFFGDAGEDTITLEAGDIATGGADADTFRVEDTATITDFVSGEDVIVVPYTEDTAPTVDSQGASGDGWTVTLSNGTVITLAGVTTALTVNAGGAGDTGDIEFVQITG